MVVREAFECTYFMAKTFWYVMSSTLCRLQFIVEKGQLHTLKVYVLRYWPDLARSHLETGMLLLVID